MHLYLNICFLADVCLYDDQGKSVEVRQAAGLLLKNNLRGAYPSMAQENQKYIKSELLPCLGAADRNIRTTVGTIISVIVNIEGVSGWHELLPALVTCLDSNDLNHMDGAMDALSKVCSSCALPFLFLALVCWTFGL